MTYSVVVFLSSSLVDHLYVHVCFITWYNQVNTWKFYLILGKITLSCRLYYKVLGNLKLPCQRLSARVPTDQNNTLYSYWEGTSIAKERKNGGIFFFLEFSFADITDTSDTAQVWTIRSLKCVFQ